MNIVFENDNYGGILIKAVPPVCLEPEQKKNFLEKWEGANEDGEVEDILNEAEKLASPKAYLIPAYVSDKNENGASVTVPFDEKYTAEKRTFSLTGSLISEKLEKNTRVIGTLTTCGRELYDYSKSYDDDPLMRIVVEDLCLAYMRVIGKEMNKYIKENIMTSDKYSMLNPGSLGSWPITAQTELFALIGEGAEKTGVTLTPTFLMVPIKSSSGLFFPTEKKFESCMRCPRLNCPNRRAPYGTENK